jgi:hypothetical protein
MACGLSALTGYALAPHRAHANTAAGRASSASAAQPSASARIASDAAGKALTTAGHQQRTAYELALLKDQIKKSLSESPNPATDFIIRAQTSALLATLTGDELREFLAECTNPNPPHGFLPDWKSVLSRLITREWGLKDPAAASVRGSFGQDVMRDWLKRDRAAAEKWLMGEGQGADAEARAKLLAAYVRDQGRDDPAASADLLEKLDANAREQVFRAWSKSSANDPDARLKLLSLVDARGDESLREKCYGDIVTAMAVKSPEEAGNFLKTTTLSEEAKNRMMDRLIGSWAGKDPADAFRWWASLKEAQPRESLIAPLHEWYFKDRDAPVNWINSLPAGPARSRYEEATILNMVSLDDYPRAATVAAAIADDDARIRQMKILKRVFDEQSKDYATKWLNNLPAKDRKAVME